MLTFAARPQPITAPRDTVAVLVIDLQNDFGSPGGMFASAGIDISAIEQATAQTARVLTAARAAGLPVVYVTMEHDEGLADAGSLAGPHRRKHAPLGLGNDISAPDGTGSRTLVRGTWSTRIVEAVAPRPGDAIVPKHRYSGFFETRLDAVLRGLGATTLIVTGCTTSVCVESTVRDAMYRDYTCIVVEDCTAEPIGAGFGRSNHEASLLVIETLFGWVSDTAAVCSALEGSA
jgi:ureidoacrylate peracid hydrolase